MDIGLIQKSKVLLTAMLLTLAAGSPAVAAPVRRGHTRARFRCAHGVSVAGVDDVERVEDTSPMKVVEGLGDGRYRMAGTMTGEHGVGLEKLAQTRETVECFFRNVRTASSTSLGVLFGEYWGRRD